MPLIKYICTGALNQISLTIVCLEHNEKTRLKRKFVLLYVVVTRASVYITKQ